MNVKSIVAEYLKAYKYDGLCLPDVQCGCLLEDLAPCGEMSEECLPGHRENIDRHTPCECYESGEDHWHIVAQQWVCECGAVCDPWSSDWRWNGMEWEHHHGYPIGHVIATKQPNTP